MVGEEGEEVITMLIMMEVDTVKIEHMVEEEGATRRKDTHNKATHNKATHSKDTHHNKDMGRKHIWRKSVLTTRD